MTAPTEDAIRIYHPDLDPNGYEVYAADETHAAIFGASGWLRAPQPPAPLPGYAPEPVRYEQDDDGKWHPVESMTPMEKAVGDAPDGAVEDLKAVGEKVRRTNKPAEPAEPEDS